MGANHKSVGSFFKGGVGPWIHRVKILIWELKGDRLGEMVKKWGRERFYRSCNYSCNISFLLKILLVKLKNLYIQHASILIMEKQNSNQKYEG